MRNKYFMAEQTGETLEIVIYGDITSLPCFENDVTADSIAKTLHESTAKDIVVKINSYGGEVAEGLAIYNELRAKSEAGAKVTTVDMGFACSSASLIFCAGDQRVMKDASLLMIHNPWLMVTGNAQQLRKAADDLDKIAEGIKAAYKQVATCTDEELQDLLDAESWLNAEEAVSYGFATEAEAAEEANEPAAWVRERIMNRLKMEEKPEEDPKDPEDPRKPINNFFKNFLKEN